MKLRLTLAAASAITALAFAPAAHAQQVDTVNWAVDTSVDGKGTGTLAGATVTVTYSTVVFGNAGVYLSSDNWNTSLATKAATGTGVTHTNAGILGTKTGSFLEQISFSDAVTNPFLFGNYTDATTHIDFGSHPVTLLSSNNAQLSGSILNFAGSANNFNDGFAAQISGSYGPGSPLTFTYYSAGSTTNFDSFAFTVAPGAASAVPEPGSIALFVGLGTVGAGFLRKRRK